MIFKQELSPQNGRYTPLLCFHLDLVLTIVEVSCPSYSQYERNSARTLIRRKRTRLTQNLFGLKNFVQ